MGWVRPRNGRFQGGYRDAHGEPHTKTFDKERDAKNWVTTNEAKVVTGDWINPKDGDISFEDFTILWRELRLHRDTTAKLLDSAMDNWVFPIIGEKAIRSVSEADIAKIIKTMNASLAPITVRNYMMWVATVFMAAVRLRRIPGSPTEKMVLPELLVEQIEPLELEVVQAIIDAIEARYAAVVGFGAGSGLRCGEALGVTLDRVDFKKKTVRVDRQLLNVAGAEPIFGPPKNNIIRTVPLEDGTLAVLEAHMDRFGTGPVAPRNAYKGGGSPLIFSSNPDRWHKDSKNGGLLKHKTFGANFAVAARPLGLPEYDGFHQIRHFYISWLIEHQCNYKEVQIRAGHKTFKVTLDIYGHLFDRANERTRAAVAEMGLALPGEPVAAPVPIILGDNVIPFRPKAS